MSKGINVLSLFDGISCARIALKRARIKVNKYYASEIDKYVLQVSQKHFPDIIQLGDVCKLRGKRIPKNIDLLIGGSPCQGFSRAGKGLNFKDPRSKLFFEFVRVLKACKPKYFLLENVKMKQEWIDIISEILSVEGIEINSALLSAQNRKRIYWTNIPGIKQPKDKGIMLEDVVEPDVLIGKNQKQAVMFSNIYGGFKEKKPRIHLHKAVTIRTAKGGGHIPSLLKLSRKGKLKRNQNKSSCLTNGAKGDGNHSNMDLLAFVKSGNIRRLLPEECERLQTIPSRFTKINGISNTQRYKMIGNAFTVDVIAHILKFMKRSRVKR